MAIKRNKKIILVITALMLAGLLLFLRGPYVSNFLKSLILPEAQSALGRQVIAKKISLNLLPLYVEAREIKMFNEEGERSFSAESVKAYIGLSQIFDRKVSIDSIVIKNPRVWMSREEAEEISANLKRASKGTADSDKSFSVKVKSIVLRGAEVSYHDEAINGLIAVSGLNAEILPRDRTEVNFSVDELATAINDWPELKAALSGNVIIGKESVEVKRIEIKMGGSSLNGTGRYAFGGTGAFRLDIDLLVDTIKQIKGLKESGYGSLRARGTLSIGEDIRDPRLDFNVKGDFHLQTLLEFLKARTSHRLTGLVSFNGRVEGGIKDIKGRADARLRKGNLYTVDVEDARCKAIYEDMKLRFTEGKGKVYGGKADFDVTLQMPRAKPYTVDVDFEGVDSPPAFERIGMSWLHLPYGKVRGKFFTSGMSFNPHGWATYEAVEPRDDPIGRIAKISGKYSMVDKIVTMSEMEAETLASHITFDGKVNLKQRTLDINTTLDSGDIKEWTTPYFSRLSGGISFQGRATGSFDDPLVKGDVQMKDVFLEEYPIGDARGKASYRKNLFSVENAIAHKGNSTYGVDGTVAFPKAQRLLELGYPEYNLNVGLGKADLEGILRLHKLDVPASGSAEANIRIEGSGTPVYSGNAEISDGTLYGFDLTSASLQFSYDFEKFRLKDAVLRNGESELMLDGNITKDLEFGFKASSKKFNINDAFKNNLPINYMMELDAEGRGTFKHPEITLKADLSGGYFGSRQLGGGTLSAHLRGRDVSYDAKLFKDRVSLNGAVSLESGFPWNAELDINKGRFDFLAAAFIKEVPEDMLFNVTGKASLSGNKDRVDADAKLTQVILAMYGQSFSNENDIAFTVKDGEFTIPEVKLRSGNTSVNLQGRFKYAEYIDAMVYGNSSLAPLKALSDNISLLRGSARYVLAINGDWDSPSVNGGIDVKGGAFGLAAIPQRLASIDGYAYFEDDTLVVDNLDAKLGGGDIELSGVIRFDGLETRSANIDMLLKDVNLALAAGFKTNLSGNLIYRAGSGSKLITGEVEINKAEYKDRIEWRSWLLRVKRAEAARAKKGLLDDLRLSIRLYGEDGIVIDNNVARAQLKIDMVLRGTIGEPLLLGRVEATEGKVYFRNSEFSIVHAAADFSDTAHSDPYVDIVAETSVKGYHIWLTLEGRPEQLDLTLISDPELDDEEILALLTVGEYGERLRGLEGGIGAAEASSVLTGQFQDIVEERLRDLTGITRFTVDPYVSRRTGTITPRVTVSKRLGSDNLFVTYSSSMSTAEEQEVKLEYIVNRNISLLGGQDDLGTLGGDVRFRFFFK